ncbi:MAG: sulfur carrier protein ThiS [Deltaproteobacteria bacterium]|nr:sulfur carrier protein ThiS [Deltaproteobacteria bacterium]
MITLNDDQIPWREGMTVADLLNGLDDPHPYAVIRVNGTYVTRPRFDTYRIPDNADIYLIPMVAGG